MVDGLTQPMNQPAESDIFAIQFDAAAQSAGHLLQHHPSDGLAVENFVHISPN